MSQTSQQDSDTATTLLSLPGEVLLEICTTLILDLGDAPSEPVVLRLCSVCKPLRELLLASPTAWTRIRLRTFADLSGASLFIERSKACLLDVSVYFDIFDYIPPEFIHNLAVARWRRLTVSGPYSYEIARFVQAISDIPTLELTDVKLLARAQSDCGTEHVPLLSGAAGALRTLTMRGCVRCLAPFPHLTRLNVSHLLCNYDEFRDLIQGSPNLTTLILGNLLDQLDLEPETGTRPLFEAPSLKALAVGFLNAYLISGDRPLLAFLSLPNLEYLEIVGSRADYGELSGKPFPALRTLCLRDMDFPTCDAALFRSFSKITRLELNNVQGMQLLMVPDETGSAPWPDLRTLVCRFPDEESCPWLCSMLDHRPRLTIYVLEQHKDDLLAAGNRHDMRFLAPDEPSGLIRAEDFACGKWGDDDDSDEEFSGSDFEHSDEMDFFSDEVDYFDNGIDEEEDYFEDEDDGLDGVWLS
ncbi:hypothetical protein FB451DRAFT_543973 [Mycena latifolia]|nr:hypothetical protein FB451DRAFT_543973 [Mycena latifolia]